jgi:hypothetical protein
LIKEEQAMADALNRQPRQGSAGEDYAGDMAPELGPMRALAEREELADGAYRLANGYGRALRADNPLMPLAHDLARAMTEAGFTLHHCVQADPLYRLGGVCLLPVAPCHDPGGRGWVVVSWTTHDLLSLDWDRWSEYQGVHEVMNDALDRVLDALGFEGRPFGTGGATLVTGRRTSQPGAGR